MRLRENLSGFDWDEGNATKSWLKHNISMSQCEEVFTNEPLFVEPDIKHSELEQRMIAFGRTDKGTKLAIAFTLRGDKIRPISARKMSRKERNEYEKKRT